jgi:DNA-directed RNA polymerase specialized sigma24 family protein
MRRDVDLAGGELERLLAERGNWLMAIALALTGERADAEDLMQAALERVLRHRRGISTEAYLRGRSTTWRPTTGGAGGRGDARSRCSGPNTSAAGTAPDDTALVDLRDELVRLLVQLPPHQRAVILLRYWEQLTASEAAEVLGCSEGAVKSATSKGLHRLRDRAGRGSVTSGPGASEEEPGSIALVSPAGHALIRMVPKPPSARPFPRSRSGVAGPTSGPRSPRSCTSPGFPGPRAR